MLCDVCEGATAHQWGCPIRDNEEFRALFMRFWKAYACRDRRTGEWCREDGRGLDEGALELYDLCTTSASVKEEKT